MVNKPNLSSEATGKMATPSLNLKPIRDVWLVSDPHLNHANILRFKREDGSPVRNFSSVSEMNEKILYEHNKVVKPQDKWYCLGDVFFGNRDEASELLSRMMGHKRLIVGNHDVVYGNYNSNPLTKHFEKIYMWRKWSGMALLLTHVPVHESTLGEDRFSGEDFVNVHGHTHEKGSPKGPYVSVCVEMINYTPVHIEEVRGLLK